MEAVSLLMAHTRPHSKSVSGVGTGTQTLVPRFVQFLPEYALLRVSYMMKGHTAEAHGVSSPSSEN